MRWRLNSGLDDTSPLEQHIQALLLTLNSRTHQIRSLIPDYQCTIQCVGYYAASGHGAHISPEFIKTAAHIGIGFDLDFYFIDDLGHDG